MKKLYLLFALSSIVIAGCGTMHAAGGANIEQEQLARSYRDNGDIQASIETYKKLIAANPHHFNSVLYQHEIMRTTEALSDPWLLVEEIKHTLQMFKTAYDENYEGATPDAIQYEREALNEYISAKGIQILSLFSKFRNNLYYSSVAMEIFRIFIDDFGDSKYYCEILYYLSELQYISEDYHAAAAGYTKVLDECNSKTRWDDKEDYQVIYKDAAHYAVLIYDRILRSDECPQMPEKTEEMFENQNYPVFPIAECEMNFINAASRFEEILKKSGAKTSEFSITSLYMAAQIYYNHNQFDKAIPLFREIIQEVPKSGYDPDVSVYSAYYILECYRLTKQYEKMLTAIREFENDSVFMSNSSPWMPELMDIFDDYEKELPQRLEK